MDKNIIDDNALKSVRIREQEWMVENLNVEHFRNGDIIPEAKTDEDWLKAGEEKRPAWCYYDNDILKRQFHPIVKGYYGEKYGKLYNWYAVNDSRGLAPEGWHVPTDDELTVLTDYLTANGHDKKEGKALKANSGWEDVREDENGWDLTNGNGTDDYGWLGLPGGTRSLTGSFYSIGCSGYWWSSSQYDTDDAWSRLLSHAHDGVGRAHFYKVEGYSVRCLRD